MDILQRGISINDKYLNPLQHHVYQPLKGFREFTDEAMASRNRVIEILKGVPQRFGFREIDIPSIEPLEIFKLKSGDEIVQQTFSFVDKGGREVTLIPETTPTVARLVASASKARQMPIKWYSFTKLWRYEEPQSGRFREFYQLNVDTFGSPDVRADAELIAVAAGILKALGLSPDVRIHISDRRLIDGYLDHVKAQDKRAVMRILDKRDKISSDEMKEMLSSTGLSRDVVETLCSLISIKGGIDDRLPEVESILGQSDATRRMSALSEMIEWYEVPEVCELDLGIVRGLDYYTSFIMEAHDIRGEYRALFGGGRYDELVSLFGGPSTPAVGFAIGDAILEILMRRAGTWDQGPLRTDCMVAVTDDSMYMHAVRLASRLREKGMIVETDLMRKKLARQLSYASAINARWVIIVGPREWSEKKVTLRNMKTGEQRSLTIDEAIDNVLKDT